MQRAALGLDDEIDVRGRAAKGRSAMACEEIIRRDRTAEGKFQVGVHVDAAGHQQQAARVNLLSAVHLQFLADLDHFFAVDEHVRRVGVSRSDDSSIRNQGTHSLSFARRRLVVPYSSSFSNASA